MQMTPERLGETGFARKARMTILPLPPGKATLRRPDGKATCIDMILISEGHRAATGTVVILEERRATPHWPVIVTLASRPVPVPVLVPAKAGSTIRMIEPAPHLAGVDHLDTELDTLGGEALQNGFLSNQQRGDLDQVVNELVRVVHRAVAAVSECPAGDYCATTYTLGAMPQAGAHQRR